MLIENLKIIQLILSVLLVLLILVQTKSNTFSSVLSSKFTMHRTKRGLESFVFYFTILLAVSFAINSLVIVYLSK